MGVDRELRVVEAQLLGAHGVEPAAKAQDLLRGQEAVAACDDQVNVFRQAVRQRAEKGGHTVVGQEVKVVDENIAGPLARERVAEIVRQEASARGVVGAGVGAQKVEPRVGKGLLHALPEDGQIVRIHADTHNGGFVELDAL